MNPEDIAKILRRLETLEGTITDVKKKVSGLAINEQLYLIANKPIVPGMACKVAYDMNGLVLRGDRLMVQDIPELPVDHITGLRQMVADKVSKNDLSKIQQTIDKMIPRKGKAVGTGTKVNYDEHGLVVSTADLLPDDIPELPMEKIEGLADVIKFLKSQHSLEGTTETHKTVPASTYCKVTCDEHGHIISGERLSVSDIPSEIISRMNIIESRMPNLASQQAIDSLNKMVAIKLDANRPITPGTYCKVRVDSKGIVTGGEQLTKKDIPTLGIRDITDLQDTLMNKADRNEFMALSETVSRITETISKIGELSGIKNSLSTMASKSSVMQLETSLKSLRETVDRLVGSMPADTISAQLSEITSQLSTISGRLTTLEKKMGVPN